MRPQKPHFNPLAALAAVLAAVVLAVCEIPEATTVPEASEALTEPPGGFDDPYRGRLAGRFRGDRRRGRRRRRFVHLLRSRGLLEEVPVEVTGRFFGELRMR